MLNLKLIFCLLLLISHSSGYASTNSYTPKMGSVERNQIISVVKKNFAAELTKPVKLRINAFKIHKGWSFLRGVLLNNAGKPMDYHGTPYQDAVDDGVFDDWFCALLRNVNGKWQLVVHSIGATDVPYLDWAERYKTPKNIFK
jgi:hypothetical protein